MAIIVNMGCAASGSVAVNKENMAERLLENPFLKMEMARVEMCRADHPSQASDGIIDFLYAWAVIYLGFCTHWFVKYVI